MLNNSGGVNLLESAFDPAGYIRTAADDDYDTERITNYTLDVITLDEDVDGMPSAATAAAAAAAAGDTSVAPSDSAVVSEWTSFFTSWMTPATLTTILVPSIFGVIMFVGTAHTIKTKVL